MKARYRWATCVVAVAIPMLAACGQSASDQASRSSTPLASSSTLVRAVGNSPAPHLSNDSTGEGNSFGGNVSGDEVSAGGGTHGGAVKTTAPAPHKPIPRVTSEPKSTPQYVGYWQRHESGLTLDGDGTGTILIGSSAADGEKWSLTWSSTDSGISGTIGKLLNTVGAGLDGYLSAGQSFSGSFANDPSGVTYLSVTGFGGTDAWCSGTYGSVDACGA